MTDARVRRGSGYTPRMKSRARRTHDHVYTAAAVRISAAVVVIVAVLATVLVPVGTPPGVPRSGAAPPIAAATPPQAPPTPRPTTAPTPPPTVMPTVVPTELPSTRAPDPTATVVSGPSQIVERGTSGRREIALTFDGGAERGDAEAILDILQDYGVVASFGVTGNWAIANPDLIQRMVDEGHMLFSHGTSHQSWTGQSMSSDPSDPTTWKPLTREERIRDLHEAEEVIGDLTGVMLQPYFRPPYADYDQSVLNVLGDMGYAVTLMWSCESLAWMGMTAEEIVEHCTTDMVPGDIILLHISDAAVDSAALPGLIEELTRQGFVFVTVDEIVQP